MVNVYLLITDRHKKETNFEGRFDYQKEVNMVDVELFKIINKYSEMGMRVIPIFMGDIWHSSYNDAFAATAENNWFVYIRQHVADMFSVVGNHELNFYKDNPFWTLFSKIESERLKSIINRLWQPRGVMNFMRIVDEIEDGNVRIVFNHFGTGVKRIQRDGKTHIGLFHQDLYAKAIAEDMRVTKDLPIFEHTPNYFDESNVLYGYDYAFLGHMHMLYGKYEYTCDRTGFVTNLEYLSTLGRTNHLEVNNKFLERNIPAVIVKDGELVRIEDNFLTLMSREESVNEEVVLHAQEIRKERKEINHLIGQTVTSDDPIQNIRNDLTVHPLLASVFDDIVNLGGLKVEDEFNRMIRELEDMSWRK